MNSDDRSRLLDLLHSSTSALKDAVRNVSDAEACKKPAEGCWSILECIEHVAVVDRLSTKRIKSGKLIDEPIIDKPREEMIMTGLPARETRFAAPEFARPQGKFRTVQDALRAFSASRERVDAFVRENAADLRRLELTHPVLGPISGYEAVLVIAAHGLRHRNQIEEIKTALQAS
jgi:uncharacterized damage-inducible protein DinB